MNHEHPDANLLAAFTENRLRGREREDLLAHLAECGECRQIIAFSSEPTLLARPRSISPAWRWAAAAAAAALVVTGTWGLRLVLLTTQNTGPPIVLTRRIKPLPSPPTAIEPQIASSTTSRTQRRPSTRSSMAKAAAAARAQPEIPAPPTASLNGITPAPNQDQDKVAVLPAAPPYKIAALELPAEKKVAPPQPGSMRQRFSTTMSGSFGMTNAKRFVPRPDVVWRVRTPAVEESSDGGVTWQPVSISDGAQFHAVAVDSAEIWAGGANGALFLSRDAGSTWKKIAVAESGAALTGTIVAIRLPAPLEIILETDAGDQWISRDGGASWNRL